MLWITDKSHTGYIRLANSKTSYVEMAKRKGYLYRYIHHLIYHIVYLNMSDIYGEIYRYIRYIGRNISKGYSNR